MELVEYILKLDSENYYRCEAEDSLCHRGMLQIRPYF
jgi:hypothetical protein